MSTDKIIHERVSLYIPQDISKTIDLQRNDIPKSKFIQRIIEKHFDIEVTKCPINCESCNRIYSSDYIQNRIICKCNCHKINKNHGVDVSDS
jgi:hypothetical protein